MKFNLLFFVRLLMRNIVLLATVPAVMAVLVFVLTSDQPKTYTTSTKIYTGIASGSSIESLDNQRFDFFATNTAFDNIINIINSRNTIETVGIKLLAQHLSLPGPDARFISEESYGKLVQIVPEEVKKLAVVGDADATYENLLSMKMSGDNNFVYKLINLEHPDYSASKIQKKITVRRISNSDMLEIKYSSEDPGICQNTLEILTEVFEKLNSAIKVNQSDAVVKYFQQQLNESSKRLKAAEDELLAFNMENNIINYYEQTKHIASQKEFFEEEYQKTQMTNSGTPAVISMLESKMGARQRLQLTSNEMLETRNKIAELNFKISMKKMAHVEDSVSTGIVDGELVAWEIERDSLNSKIRLSVDSLYQIETTSNGLVTKNLLDDWLANVMLYEESKAQLKMLDMKRLEFRQLYTEFAPLGATMMRLERKINVAEQEYLSLLHSLGLAKLKQQNIELTSNIKTVDEPIYPIVSEPSKRKFLVIVAGMAGFILVMFAVLVLHFLDSNMGTALRASEQTGFETVAIFPKINYKNKKLDVAFLEQKAIEAIARNVIFISKKEQGKHGVPSVNFLVSAQNSEGKSFIATRLCEKLAGLGYHVLFVVHSDGEPESSGNFETVHYVPGQRFYRVGEMQQLHPKLTDGFVAGFDFVFVEIPSVILHAFPVKLFGRADHIYLVCRANRAWGDADRNAMKSFCDVVPQPVPLVLLNGVEMIEMETVLGDLPRKRSWLRRSAKNFLRMRFFSKTKVL